MFSKLNETKNVHSYDTELQELSYADSLIDWIS